MFHIVFNADDNYIKYAAVLINSIIKNTNKNKKFKDFCKSQDFKAAENSLCDDYENIDFNALSKEEKKEGYVFHIMSDFISEKNRSKLAKFQSILSQIYPCEIKIYILKDDLFKNYATWGENQNHSTYYRLMLSEILPLNLKRCLYLDVDMLAFIDLRELFAIDLKDKIAGIVLGSKYLNKQIFKYKDIYKGEKMIQFENCYFNAGFMLINLDKWRAENIQDKALQALKKWYLPLNDQDALNVAFTKRKNVLIMPFCYNIFSSFLEPHFNIENSLSYTAKEFKNAYEHAKIFHYNALPKPWQIQMENFNKNDLRYNFMQSWWNLALTTPIFNKEFNKKQNTMKEKLKLIRKKFKKFILLFK